MLNPRRWLVLGGLMAVTWACEAQWLVHAAAARPAAVFYGGQFDPSSIFNIDFLALVYMAAFLVAALPSSVVLHRRGLGFGVGIGAVLVLVGSVGKAVFARSFAAQMVFQTLLAVAQPFLTNAATTLARDWFPPQERATAAGLATLAQYLGFVTALAAVPLLVQANPALAGYGSGFDLALAVVGVLTAAGALFALAVVRSGPGAPAPGTPRQSLADGLGALASSGPFWLVFGLFLVGLGILNAVSSLTDTLAAGLGVKDSDGLLGLGLIGGGIVGAVVLPLASDAAARRKVFLVAGCGGAALGLVVPALVPGGYGLAIACLTVVGFCLLGAGPVGFQYAAEITPGVPESLSQGVLLWAGQASGLALTAALSAAGPGGMVPGLALMAGAMGLVCLATAFLKDPPGLVKPGKGTP